MSDTRDRAPVRPSPAVAGTVLAFDFGTRKIGVALGNTVTATARALTTVREEAKAARFAAIAALVAEWQPALLVVGRPLHADGSEHAMTAQADKFLRELSRRFSMPVAAVDERYTTQVAQIDRAGCKPRRGRDAGRDADAARIILQAWLDSRPAQLPPNGA